MLWFGKNRSYRFVAHHVTKDSGQRKTALGGAALSPLASNSSCPSLYASAPTTMKTYALFYEIVFTWSFHRCCVAVSSICLKSETVKYGHESPGTRTREYCAGEARQDL
jgi:hypothetical protein